MKKKLDSSYQSRSSVANKHQTSFNDSRILKQTLNPLFKIYQIERNHIWCKSCKMDVFEKEAYKHLYEDQHIHILQRDFLRNKIKSASNHQKSGIRLELKQKSFSQQLIKKQNEIDNLNKSRDITIRQQIKSYKQFVSKLIEDLNLIGHSNLSLLVALLSETQCNINIFYELTFQQIIDRNSLFVIKLDQKSQEFYSINKQRIPEFLKQFILKNLGSNKSIIDWKSKNKCNYLRSQMRNCCMRLANITKDKEYQQFLIGLKLRDLKGLALQQQQYQNEMNNQLQTDETEKVQIIQQNGKEQREENLQILGDQRKPNIRIVIKSKVQN